MTNEQWYIDNGYKLLGTFDNGYKVYGIVKKADFADCDLIYYNQINPNGNATHITPNVVSPDLLPFFNKAVELFRGDKQNE